MVTNCVNPLQTSPDSPLNGMKTESVKTKADMVEEHRCRGEGRWNDMSPAEEGVLELCALEHSSFFPTVTDWHSNKKV